MNEFIRLEEAEGLDILLEGSKYAFVCEYQAKDGTYQSVYAEKGGYNVLVDILKEDKDPIERAIVGLFSVAPSKISELFDYIEATLPRNSTFVTVDLACMNSYLALASAAGNKYTVIRSAIGEQEPSFLSNLASRLLKPKELSKSLAEKVKEHTVPAEFWAKDDLAEYKERLESEDHVTLTPPAEVPANTLPQGWKWVDYADKSGHLESPDGKSFFSYDMQPYVTSGGIEFKENIFSGYSLFEGSLSDFKAHAEAVVSKNYLHQKDGLNSQIQSASGRVVQTHDESNSMLKTAVSER